MKRLTHRKLAKKATINVMASGLSGDEIEKLENLIREMAIKRSHEGRSQLLYDLLFNDCQSLQHGRCYRNQYKNKV